MATASHRQFVAAIADTIRSIVFMSSLVRGVCAFTITEKMSVWPLAQAI